MAVRKKYPTPATISWQSVGTKDAEGVYTPGASNSISIDIDAQPASGTFKSGIGGDLIKYAWKISCELFTGSDSFPIDGNIKFLGVTYKILSFFEWEKHVEIKC